MACQTPLKTCTDSCSGHGVCSFVSTNTGKAMSTCYVGDPQCYAMCTCNTKFFGLSCGEDAATFTGNQELKYVLVTGLYNLTVSRDGDSNTVLGWAATAASLSQNYAQLTTTSLSLLTKIMKTVLAAASESSIPYNQVSLLFAISICQIFSRSIPTALTSALLISFDFLS